MRYLKTAATVIFLLFASTSFAQQAIVSGSKTAYPYDPAQTLTPAPNDYQAFYIDHVGRHGSRYISKPKYEEVAYKILSLAEKDQQLTPEGKQLLTQVISIMKLNKDRYGELTDLGRQDIDHIGQRMLANNPTVFKGHNIDVISSTSPRAKESAEIFLQSFKKQYPNIEVKQQPEDEQTLLRFFEYSPAYNEYKESKSVKNQVKSIEQAPKTAMMSDEVAKKVFTNTFLAKLDKGLEGVGKSPVNTNDFAIAVYALYQELLSFTPQTLNDNHLDFSAYFSDAENRWFDAVITSKNYLQIGPAFDANGIQIKIAAPLLWDMIHTADEAIANQNVDANLRFAHAETVSPLATLLEIENTYSVTKSFFDYQSVWKAENIIPMGANIQFLFYKHNANNQSNEPVLVKVLLNEKEVHLPMATNSYPYYRWEEVKQFYVNKLNRLGLPENQSAMELLKTIK